LGPIPNPQSPIPNPQFLSFFNLINELLLFKKVKKIEKTFKIKIIYVP
jgi:hypothetical protein